MHAWFVYCVQCKDGSVYTGATTDVARRVREHNRGTGGAYTRSRRPVTLVYRERLTTRSAALRRELEIKGWPRREKRCLIKGLIRRQKRRLLTGGIDGNA